MTVEQLELMRSLHIASENGGYRFGGYLYERLGDAVSHARHLRARRPGRNFILTSNFI